MSEHSTIEWTDATWNPVRGCTKISPGCKYCYAETFAERFRDVKGPYELGFDLRLVPEKLLEPLRWARPMTVFLNSMSDICHEDVPVEYIVAVARIMEMTPWHTYQVLTKRVARLVDLLRGPLAFAAKFPHIWWGVSVDNREYGLSRLELLRGADTNIKFLSIEPLLEDLGPVDFTGFNWVIVGGESGHGARPMEASWVRRIRASCETSGVPFFFKQWGGVQKKKKAGRLLDGRTYDDMPTRTSVAAPSKDARLALLEHAERLIAAPVLTGQMA